MRIFVSYRRADSAALAGRVTDRLRDQPKIDNVFFDVQDIEPGTRFPDRIAAALESCDVMIIVIGPAWIGPREGSPRIFDADDFVRQEAARAIAAKKRVLPILINNAQMPSALQLPDDLRDLVNVNATTIRHEAFDRDMDELVHLILGERRSSTLRQFLRRHPFLAFLARGALGMAVASMLLVIGAAVHQLLTGGKSLDQTLGRHVWLLIVGVLFVGASWPFLRGALAIVRR